MIQAEDIFSLTSFQRNAKSHIKRLHKTRRPEILTINGKAAVVVQDPKAYQQMLDAVDRAEALEAVRQGLESMQHGQGMPLREFAAKFRKKHKLPK